MPRNLWWFFYVVKLEMGIHQLCVIIQIVKFCKYMANKIKNEMNEIHTMFNKVSHLRRGKTVLKSISSLQLSFNFAFRTVPPLVTAHTVCATWVWSKILKFFKEFAY